MQRLTHSSTVISGGIALAISISYILYLICTYAAPALRNLEQKYEFYRFVYKDDLREQLGCFVAMEICYFLVVFMNLFANIFYTIMDDMDFINRSEGVVYALSTIAVYLVGHCLLALQHQIWALISMIIGIHMFNILFTPLVFELSQWIENICQSHNVPEPGQSHCKKE